MTPLTFCRNSIPARGPGEPCKCAPFVCAMPAARTDETPSLDAFNLTSDEELRKELSALSFRHTALDVFLRGPGAQRVSDAERAAMRHQLRAYDDALYWLRQRVRVRGMA